MCGANRPKNLAGVLVNIFSKLLSNLNFLEFIGQILDMSTLESYGIGNGLELEMII